MRWRRHSIPEALGRTGYYVSSCMTPTARANSLLVDSEDRIVAAGLRLWDFNFPIPDSDHAVTRLERDHVFLAGFDI